MNLRYTLFKYSYSLFKRDELKYLHTLNKNSSLSFDELRERQYLEVRRFVNYCYDCIPFYQRQFRQINFDPRDFNNLDVLNELPILTKQDIKDNLSDFLPTKSVGKVYRGSTGGSTGVPLKYSMSKECYEMGVALMYRGWQYAGYNLGDPVLVFAGGSLVGKSSVATSMIKSLRNFKSVSSYGVSVSELDNVISTIKSWCPKFIRGYASSLSFLSERIIELGGGKALGILSPKAIFTTAEMLSLNQRSIIELAFDTKVFNQYGLNDGGISAFENHRVADGFLVDSERGLMECVDSSGTNVMHQTGRLLATSFRNRAFPFLRYDTGDLGSISDEFVNRGGNRLILKTLYGRSTDFLEFNGRKVGSPVLTVLMGKIDVIRYQIVQKKTKIEFRISKGEGYTDESEEFIRNSISEHLGDCEIVFDYSGIFLNSQNKHKFIIKTE